MRAWSRNERNLISLLHRTSGFGVRPAAYSRKKAAKTRSRYSAAKFTACSSMPTTSATEAASTRSCLDEQYSSVSSSSQFFMKMPTTSCPAFLSSHAATDESTPPERPTTMRCFVFTGCAARASLTKKAETSGLCLSANTPDEANPGVRIGLTDLLSYRLPFQRVQLHQLLRPRGLPRGGLLFRRHRVPFGLGRGTVGLELGLLGGGRGRRAGIALLRNQFQCRKFRNSLLPHRPAGGRFF